MTVGCFIYSPIFKKFNLVEISIRYQDQTKELRSKTAIFSVNKPFIVRLETSVPPGRLIRKGPV